MDENTVIFMGWAEWWGGPCEPQGNRVIEIYPGYYEDGRTKSRSDEEPLTLIIDQ